MVDPGVNETEGYGKQLSLLNNGGDVAPAGENINNFRNERELKVDTKNVPNRFNLKVHPVVIKQDPPQNSTPEPPPVPV